MLLSQEARSGDDWWNFVPEIPQSIWSRLGLCQWEHPELDLVNKFQGTVASLPFLIDHICDFTRLPELGEQGRGVLKSCLEPQSEIISKAFQQILDQMRQLAGQSNKLPTEQQLQRQSLLAAVQTFATMRDNVLPCTDFDGALYLDLASAKEWLRRLEVASVEAEEVRLHWATDVLDLLVET